jgi:hypothetical protein
MWDSVVRTIFQWKYNPGKEPKVTATEEKVAEKKPTTPAKNAGKPSTPQKVVIQKKVQYIHFILVSNYIR